MELFYIKEHPYPIPSEYLEYNGYLLKIWTGFFRADFFHRKGVFNLRSSLYYSPFGVYILGRGVNYLSGVYLLFEGSTIKPYIAFYSSLDFGAILLSAGIRIKDEWMLAFFAGQNKTKVAYPLDPAGIPAEILNDDLGADGSMYFNSNDTGIEFFWNREKLTVCGYLFQNYPDFKFEHLHAMIMLKMASQF